MFLGFFQNPLKTLNSASSFEKMRVAIHGAREEHVMNYENTRLSRSFKNQAIN